MLNNSRNLYVAAALGALAFIGYIVLTITGHDASNLFMWITSMGSLVAASLSHQKSAEASTKVDNVATKLDKVSNDVNGRMTQLIAAKTTPAEGSGESGISGANPNV